MGPTVSSKPVLPQPTLSGSEGFLISFTVCSRMLWVQLKPTQQETCHPMWPFGTWGQTLVKYLLSPQGTMDFTVYRCQLPVGIQDHCEV